MKCPNCDCIDDKVTDTRSAHENRAIRRRRECIACGTRFTTYETIESPLQVIKRDGTHEEFNPHKIIAGLKSACHRRPISSSILENIVTQIKNQLEAQSRKEISTIEIGNFIMEKLREIDSVAYVRFASVYREFKDVSEFMDEVQKINNKKQ